MPNDPQASMNSADGGGLAPKIAIRAVLLVAFVILAYAGIQYVSRHRPPAEPTDPPSGPIARGEIVFDDVTSKAGIRFDHYDSASPSHFIHETIGSGVAWIDYDNDGWPDLLFVQDAPLPGSAAPAQPPTHALYRNLGNGTFTDVTKQSGLDQPGFGLGAAVGDYDNDGFDDLAVTYLGRVALYHNVPDGKGSRRFEEASRTGIVDAHFATSCAWGDIDGDGLLDLYVCNYIETDLKNYPVCVEPKLRINHTCSPLAFPSVAHSLFRNRGDGTFEDVSVSSGIAAATPAPGLGVAMVDFDGDDWLDIFVANDMKPAYLFHNLGRGKFKERATLAGCGFAPDGSNMAGMGVAIGDVDDSGRPSVFVTNFQDAPNVLFLNRGRMSFADSTFASGLGFPSLRKLGFGAEFLDADLDGTLDVVVVNGHVSRIAPEAYRAPYQQEAQVFRGEGKGKFRDVSSGAGEYFRKKFVGRGLAAADFDRDGKPDLAIGNCGGPGVLLRNTSQPSGNWLKLELVGDFKNAGPTGRKSPRSAIGARVEVTCGGRKLTRYVVGGGSYLSASDPTILIGLGACEKPDEVVVFWPSGLKQVLEVRPANARYRVVEGAGSTRLAP